MIFSEEDKERLMAAKTCNSCLQWHKYCNAECCKIIYLDIDPQELKKRGAYIKIILKRPLSLDELWYYRLHDVLCTRNTLRFKRERVIASQGQVMYIHPCKLLKDNKCMGHPDNKPQMCKQLTYENIKNKPTKFKVTPNCLFRYKRWLEDVEGT